MERSADHFCDAKLITVKLTLSTEPIKLVLLILNLYTGRWAGNHFAQIPHAFY